jgi:hypothetical protein
VGRGGLKSGLSPAAAQIDPASCDRLEGCLQNGLFFS